MTATPLVCDTAQKQKDRCPTSGLFVSHEARTCSSTRSAHIQKHIHMVTGSQQSTMVTQHTCTSTCSSNCYTDATRVRGVPRIVKACSRSRESRATELSLL